jgi:hypothetical protein
MGSRLKTGKVENLKFYKVMAGPVLLYGSETDVEEEGGWNSSRRKEIPESYQSLH